MIRTRRLWEDRFYPTDKGWGSFDISLDSDKKTLLVAGFEKGLHRYRLDPNSSTVIEKEQIKEKGGHRGAVLKVSWHPSGRKFATCGSDRLIIVWKDDFTSEKQIKLPEVPQTIAWNPKSFHLIGAGGAELISFQGPREPVFSKMPSAIWSAAWNYHGEVYALGMENGAISLRDRRDNELCVMHRSNNPIWTLCWGPPDSPKANLLVVADWNRNIGFYEVNGKQQGSDYVIDFLPLSLSYSADGQLIYVCGADKHVHVLSTECFPVGKISGFRTWPLKCVQKRQELIKSEFFVMGADGLLNMLETVHNKCSHIHMGIYASRESLVNLSVRGLERNREITLSIQDSIRFVAVYRNLIAVAVSQSVVILRQVPEELMLKYEEQVRIPQFIECNQLSLAGQHLLIIQQSSIQTMAFTGTIQESWTFSDEIRCVKVVGGKAGAESVLIALQTGEIRRIILSQPFIHSLVKVPNVPICIDMNQNWTKLAVVCENSVLYVYDAESKELLYQEAGADGCAWNLNHPEMIAFSMHSLLKIKLGDQRAHIRRMETPLHGVIVGYVGSKLFYETEDRVVVVDVPHSMLIHQSMESRNFHDAYQIACFGVSDNDWKVLGNRALDNLELTVAKNCFRRVRDFPLLQLIDEIEQRTKVGDGNSDMYLGDIYAFRGRFEDAARFYTNGGRQDLAVKLFTDLRKFEQAELWATDQSQRRALLELRASWVVKEDDKRQAVDLYLQLDDVTKAMELMKDLGWAKRILDTARNLDTFSQRGAIISAAQHLLELGNPDSAVELFERVKDIKTVIDIKLAKGEWEYLLSLADREPFYREMILMPYAQYLIERDRFAEANVAFARADHPEVAAEILAELVKVAVDIRRFSDVAFYNWLIGKSADERACRNADKSDGTVFFNFAEVYHAYAVIDSAVLEPFSTLPDETIFNSARILAAKLWRTQEMPSGVSFTSILYVLAVWAMKVQAFKTARMALERLKDFRIPKNLYGKFTEVFVQNRTRPFQDPEKLSDYCNACASYSPLLNVRNGYSCQTCGNRFRYCQVSFEHLPLVEFVPEEGITPAEACALISMEPSANDNTGGTGDGSDEVVRFGDSRQNGTIEDDFFAGWKQSGPIVVSRRVLRGLRDEEVVVLKHSLPQRWQFYRNMLADVARITACSSCWQLFNYEDYFASVLELHCCPFCKDPVKLHVDDSE